ncbi:MAG: hypothetical protein AVDCRST_MAG17-731, partial [uncultured Solirubrobacterales bacterium]
APPAARRALLQRRVDRRSRAVRP